MLLPLCCHPLATTVLSSSSFAFSGMLYKWIYIVHSLKNFFFNLEYCCCLVSKSCPVLCDPIDCSTPGLPVPHYLPKFAQGHIHWISDAIQPSHSLPPSSPFAFNLSQHQRLFQWAGSSPKYWRFTFNISPSNSYSGLISFQINWFDLAVQGTLQESSTTPQFESIISLVPILPCGPTLTFAHDYWKNHSFDDTDLYQQI